LLGTLISFRNKHDWVGQGEVSNCYHSLAPYERRIIELLRNSKDKRARKLAKKKVRIANTFDLGTMSDA